MDRTYRDAEAAANADPNYSILAQAKMQLAARQQGILGNPQQHTELASLLQTLRDGASEIRAQITQLHSRVAPQTEQEGCDRAEYGTGYVSLAEETRSIHSETLRILAELSKYA